MATPAEYIRVICSDLYDTGSMDIYVELASGVTSEAFFGDQWAKAVALLAAHEYTLDTKRKGQQGVETYRMEGRLALSYGGMGVIRDPLELTNYGMQYKALRQGRMTGISISDPAILTTYEGTL
jgi:hypothetical protein